MRKILFSSLTVVFLVSEAVFGTTYYVKPSGNDFRSGTDTSNAWETIERAFSMMSPGDTTLVLEGTYAEDNLCPSTSSVALKAYPGHEVWVAGVNSAGSGRAPVFWLDGVSDITIDSINVKYGRGVTILFGLNGTADRCKFVNATVCSVYAGWGSQTADIVEFMEHADSCEIRNCILFRTGLNGSHPNSHNNCAIIHYANNPGSGRGHVVRKNVIHDVVTGIWYKHSGEGAWWVDSNTVYDFSWSGICSSTDSAFIHHNLIYDGYYGIRIGEAAGGLEHTRWSQIYNNTIDDCRYGGIYFYWHAGDINDSNQVWNNIMTNCTGGEVNEYRINLEGTAQPDSLYSDYNCFYDSSDYDVIRWTSLHEYTLNELQTAEGYDEHSIQTSPLYTDPANWDFALLPQSPCGYGGRGGDYESYMGAFPPIDGTDSLVTTATHVGEATDSSFLIRTSITTQYSETCDSTVLWVDTSSGLTGESMRKDVFTNSNLDTLEASGLHSETVHYYWCVAWDEGNADTTDMDSIITTSGKDVDTYYVKPAGNDGYSGTDTLSGWATIGHAFGVVSSGDTILVLEGIYEEDSLTPSSDSVTLKAYPGHEVWVTGVQSAGSGRAPIFWIDRSNGIYGIVIDSINVKYGRGVSVMFGNDFDGGNCKFLNAKVCSTYAGWGGETADMIEVNRVDNCEVRNCTLFVTGLGGTMQTNHNNCGMIIYSDASTGGGHTFRGNVIHDVVTGIWYKRGGVGPWWCDSNTVYDYHWAGIVSTTDSARIHHNLVYAGDSVGHHGILVADSAGGEMDTRYGLIYNNTIDGCDWGGICVNWISVGIQDTIDIWNNIITNCPAGDNNEYKILQRTSAPPESLYSDYNCIYDYLTDETIRWLNGNYYTLTEFQNAVNKDVSSTALDPLFADPANGDYTLQEGSPCGDAGRGGSYENYMGAFVYSYSRDPVTRGDIDGANRDHKEGSIMDEHLEALIERYEHGE